MSRFLLLALLPALAYGQGYPPRGWGAAGGSARGLVPVAELPTCSTVNRGYSYLLTTDTTVHVCGGSSFLRMLSTDDGQAVNADEDITPRGMIAQAASGEYAYRVNVAGAITNFGPVPNANCAVDAEGVVACGIFAFAQAGIDQLNPKTSTSPITFVSSKGLLHVVTAALGTCALAREGTEMRDNTSGGTSGDRTRICLCTSDGGGTPAYAWVNIGCPDTVGDATTCPVCP
jgi:hypothetical protein